MLQVLAPQASLSQVLVVLSLPSVTILHPQLTRPALHHAAIPAILRNVPLVLIPGSHKPPRPLYKMSYISLANTSLFLTRLHNSSDHHLQHRSPLIATQYNLRTQTSWQDPEWDHQHRSHKDLPQLIHSSSRHTLHRCYHLEPFQPRNTLLTDLGGGIRGVGILQVPTRHRRLHINRQRKAPARVRSLTVNPVRFLASMTTVLISVVVCQVNGRAAMSALPIGSLVVGGLEAERIVEVNNIYHLIDSNIKIHASFHRITYHLFAFLTRNNFSSEDPGRKVTSKKIKKWRIFLTIFFF